MSNYVYTETDHLDHHSIFHNIQLPNDKDLLEAVWLWESTADGKYIDILGYGLQMLAKSVAPRDCTKIEIDRIDKIFKTGSGTLLTGYGDLDLVQIPLIYRAMLTGRWDDLIAVKATRKYLDSGDDDTMIDQYFSREWVVSIQVQALIWYKEEMLNVEKNGISLREDKNPTNNDITSLERTSSQKQDNWCDLFINFTKEVLNMHPNASTADLRRNCFEDMKDLNSRDCKIINKLLVKAGTKLSKKGEHAKDIVWKSKYPREQWERVFNKI